MKRSILFLLLVAVFVNAQQTRNMVRGEDDEWKFMRSDSSGVIFTTPGPVEPTATRDTTLAVTTSWDTLALASTFEIFSVINNSAGTVYLSLCADTAAAATIPPNIAYTLYGQTDSLAIKGSASINVIINMFNRERF
jgi:hypothetical protein